MFPSLCQPYGDYTSNLEQDKSAKVYFLHNSGKKLNKGYVNKVEDSLAQIRYEEPFTSQYGRTHDFKGLSSFYKDEKFTITI